MLFLDFFLRQWIPPFENMSAVFSIFYVLCSMNEKEKEHSMFCVASSSWFNGDIGRGGVG